jgi:hypothetical protein
MKMKRIQVNIADEEYAALESMATSKKTTKTEVLRSSIKCKEYLENAIAAGKKVILEDGSGRQVEVVFHD